jgi:hypothetical protein
VHQFSLKKVEKGLCASRKKKTNKQFHLYLQTLKGITLLSQFSVHVYCQIVFNHIVMPSFYVVRGKTEISLVQGPFSMYGVKIDVANTCYPAKGRVILYIILCLECCRNSDKFLVYHPIWLNYLVECVCHK